MIPKLTIWKKTSDKPKDKIRSLFYGMFIPLLSITFVSGVLFAIVCGILAVRYTRSETRAVIENLNRQITDFLAPAIINAEDISNIAGKTQDEDVLKTVVHSLVKNLPSDSFLYYATKTSRFEKDGFFVNSSDWIPPDTWDPSKRGWFTSAVENNTSIHFEEPYIDEMTKSLCVTISKAVKYGNGTLSGVVGVDLLLNDLIKMVNKVSESARGNVYLLSDSGIYLTHPNPAKAMVENYFDNTKLSLSKEQYLDGTQKILLKGGRYYAVASVKNTPWFIAVEGPISDFTGGFVITILMFEIILIAFSIICSKKNIQTIKDMRAEEAKMSEILFEEAQNLVVSTKETAATSQDSAAAVKEIVATMEDSNMLSESISSKIKSVSNEAGETSVFVTEGVAQIEQNVAQLQEIFNANQQTLDGIKNLTEKIENIWDIVTLINNVADQAKIIAFNAELEAATAGEAGKSFRIVANEIRRLSDGIIDGTHEIKEKINEIQHSSDTLILTSKGGTEKITEGYENARGLSEKFDSIKNSAEVTAKSANDIADIIQQQASASEQILIALKEISAGVENFTVATDNISSAAENVRKISEELNKTKETAES